MLVGLAMVCIHYYLNDRMSPLTMHRPIWRQQCQQPEVYISGHIISQATNGEIR